MSKINSVKIYSTVNGEGIRTAVFFSGCNLHCKGCFNKEAQNFNFGVELDKEKINEILDTLDNDYTDGLSILGGEPLDENNQESVLELINLFKKRFKTKNIWLWTGYTLDNIPKTKFIKSILKTIDVLIDGPFIAEKQDLNLAFRGSSNQRILLKGKDF